MAHGNKPTYKSGSIDAFLSKVRAWEVRKAAHDKPKPQPTGLPGGPQVVTKTGSAEPTQPGGPGDGWWTISPATGEWKWISLGTGTNESAGTTQSFSSGGGGRTLQEDLDYLAAKYGWDEKLELAVLEREYKLRGHFEDERFKDAKELQKMDAASRIAYLREEIGLTKTMKMELMVAQHGFDKIMQDDKFEFERVESALDRDFRADESLLNRELEEKLQGLDIESREALAEAKIAADKAMQAAALAHAAKLQAGEFAHDKRMQGAGFLHDLKIQAGQQAFDKVMQERGFANDRFLQERELTIRVAINESNIKSNELISEKKIAADKAMQATQIAFDKEQKEEDRKLRRFEEVQKLRGKDPVRAALMAMGAGEALDQFGGSFADLGPMEGADVLQADTELALQGIAGLGAAGEAITLGDTGVEGLQSVEKAGRSFVQGPASTRTLVTSAQGVGGSTQAGVSEEDVSARIQAITPKGFEQRTAAGGVGPYLIPMVQQQYAADGRGHPQINAPRAIGMSTNRPDVQPNTSYTVGEGQKGDGTRPEVVTTGDNKELLSIEPSTVDPGTTLPVNTGGDPLVDMFNDPNLTINREDQILLPLSQGRPIQDIAANPNNDAAIKAQRIGVIKGKIARGEPLTPEEQAEWDAERARQVNQPGLEPTNQVMSDRRRAYMESLPPAQQAQIRQTQQNQLRTQQEKLVSSLTPNTIQKLMELINNPSRQVNTTLQEQLPQLRDGAGNIRQPQQNLARVV